LTPGYSDVFLFDSKSLLNISKVCDGKGGGVLIFYHLDPVFDFSYTENEGKRMKCSNCAAKMTEVYSWIEHPGPEGRMMGHPGPLLYHECKQCGNKVESEKEVKKIRES
jgi:hypothetical protein